MDLLEWIQQNNQWLAILGILSAIMFVATLILIPIIIVRIPPHYFVSPHKGWLRSHPAFIPLFVIQHLIGLVLLIAGILMLVLPGQGLLSILIGLSLIHFPGKHRLLQRLITIKRIHQPMNWIRAKAKVPPLQIPSIKP